MTADKPGGKQKNLWDDTFSVSLSIWGNTAMIRGYMGKKPYIKSSAFIAEGTIIIGDACIGDCSSIWYGTVIRGDVNKIIIGSHTNIQDNCTIHCARDIPTVIGDYVTIGHGAVIHGCSIADNCLIGIGAIVMDGSEIGEHSIVGAGALITPGQKIPPCSMVVGLPGKVVRSVTDSEKEGIRRSAHGYVQLSKKYL